MSMSSILGCADPTGSFCKSEDHFVPTPERDTHALLQWLYLSKLIAPGSKVHECACGNGAISKLLELYGYEVVSTNLINRGYGTPGVDFLQLSTRLADIIITNPPWSAKTGTAAQFIAQAKKLEVPILCLLLKTNFLQAAVKRGWIAYEDRPVWKLELGWRSDFTGGGASTLNCAWFIWCFDPEYLARWREPYTRHIVLPKPLEYEAFKELAA